MTGHWNRPDEPGWGLVVTHQGDTLFALLFAYDADRNPTWYAMPNLEKEATGNSYKGLVYRTARPPVTATFDPAQVQVQQVGDAQFTPNADGSAAFTYTINGATVTRTIRSLTFRLPPLAGFYFMRMFGTVSSCTNPAHDIPPTARPFVQTEEWSIHPGDGGNLVIDRVVDGDIVESVGEPLQVEYAGLTTTVRLASRKFPSGKGSVATLKLASVDASGFIGEITIVDDPVFPGCIVRGNLSGLRPPG